MPGVSTSQSFLLLPVQLVFLFDAYVRSVADISLRLMIALLQNSLD